MGRQRRKVSRRKHKVPDLRREIPDSSSAVGIKALKSGEAKTQVHTYWYTRVDTIRACGWERRAYIGIFKRLARLILLLLLPFLLLLLLRLLLPPTSPSSSFSSSPGCWLHAFFAVDPRGDQPVFPTPFPPLSRRGYPDNTRPRLNSFITLKPRRSPREHASSRDNDNRRAWSPAGPQPSAFRSRWITPMHAFDCIFSSIALPRDYSPPITRCRQLFNPVAEPLRVDFHQYNPWFIGNLSYDRSNDKNDFLLSFAEITLSQYYGWYSRFGSPNGSWLIVWRVKENSRFYEF